MSITAESTARLWSRNSCDDSQQSVLENAQERTAPPVLVYGAPGSGKSSLAVELALRNLAEGYDSKRLLLLSPTRLSAARLSDELDRRLAAGLTEEMTVSFSEQPVKSFASYAFWLLGQARRLGVAGAHPRPRLLSGAEQDQIIGRLLTAKAEAAQNSASAWHELKDAFTAEKGLRRELRDFLDRCREYSISEDQLREYAGLPGGRLLWSGLAELVEDYERTLAEDYPGAYDAAALITHACNLLEQPLPAAAGGEVELFLDWERTRLNRILVDDVQDASPSVYRLLRLIGVDHHMVAFANPDTAVQGFRGARPDKLAHWDRQVTAHTADPAGSVASADPRSQYKPAVAYLDTSYRLCGETAELYRKVVQRIGVVSTLLRKISPTHTQTDPAPSPAVSVAPEATAEVSATAVASVHLVEQLVLQKVLHARHTQHVPWEQIAVLARSGSELHRVTRTLSSQGVPVARSVSDSVLREENAVKPLLRILQGADTDRVQPGLDYQDVVSLLSSAYGGVDAVQLRRIHQELLRRYREAAETARPQLPQPDEFAELSLAELLVLHCTVSFRVAEQLGLPELVEAADETSGDPQNRCGWIFRPLLRIRRMVQAARTALGEQELADKPEQALWAVWSAAGVAEAWQRRASQAEGADIATRQANRNLDAVITLFQTAERYVGQQAHATVESFIDYIDSLELPMDSIAETGAQSGAVEVLTPSTAAGREFHTVIVVGLQDGEWPNLRPRGELLGSSDLVTLSEAGPEAVTTDLRSKRAHVLQDENRLFAAAVSRAAHRVELIAVDADDTRPSSLFDLVSPPHITDEHGGKHQRNALTRVPRAIGAAALAAELRSVLESHRLPDAAPEDPDAPEPDVHAAARLLAQLAAHHVPGAHPSSWWGYQGFTSAGAPITDPDQSLSISPSAVDSAISNPLDWFTGAAGGTTPPSAQQSLGSFIHQLAEEHPQGSPEELAAELAERWPAFRPGASWTNDQEKARAQRMVRNLGHYYAEANGRERKLIGAELFLHHQQQVPLADGSVRTVEIRGKADRVEWAPADPEGSTPAGFYVVDFKTGRTVPSDQDVASWYPQIDIYQWTAVQGAVTTLLRRMLTAEPTELSERDQQTRAGLLATFDKQQIGWEPETQSLSFTLDGQPVSVPLDEEAEQQVAGAALVQLGSTNKSLKLQTAGPGAAERGAAQAVQAAQVMSGHEFTAHHDPGKSSCYAGLLCPLCSTGKQVSEA